MLVQVKHRGWVFIQGFYYKNKGRGRVVHTAESREICKNKVKKGRIKFKTHTHNNCFYGREIYPEIRELQYPLQILWYIQIADLTLLILKYQTFCL